MEETNAPNLAVGPPVRQVLFNVTAEEEVLIDVVLRMSFASKKLAQNKRERKALEKDYLALK